MAAIAIWSPLDPLLGLVAPLALATSVKTALLVDLDDAAPPFPTSASLADLVARGPTKAEITPRRSGVAVLSNGGITEDDATEVIDALVDGWPRVVFRTSEAGTLFAPRVPVLPLLPKEIVGDYGPAVYQRLAWSAPTPDGSITVPRPSAGSVEALLALRRPVFGPWLRRWRTVWDTSWA